MACERYREKAKTLGEKLIETKALCVVRTRELEDQVDEAKSKLATIEIDLVRATLKSPLASPPLHALRSAV